MPIDTDFFRKNLLKYTGIAFNLLPKMEKPAILDAGCGTGVPTIYLAQISGGTVTGVDTDEKALEKLKNKLRDMKLTKQITVVRSSFENKSYIKGEFDIVWAEGSVHEFGFSKAINILGNYVRKGGFLVVHDESADYLKKIKAVEQGNYKLHGFFFLDENIWRDEYFKPIEEELRKISLKQPLEESDRLQKEIEEFKRNPEKYTSAFFMMQKY